MTLSLTCTQCPTSNHQVRRLKYYREYLLRYLTLKAVLGHIFTTFHSEFNMPPIKFGFVGYSGSTKFFHLPYVMPNVDLEIFAFLQRAPAPEDPTAAKPGTHCRVDSPKAKHYRTNQDFLADELIELTVVRT
jgi:hypothetical protein